MITLLLFGWSLPIDLYYFFDHSLNRIATLKKKQQERKFVRQTYWAHFTVGLKKKKRRKKSIESIIDDKCPSILNFLIKSGVGQTSQERKKLKRPENKEKVKGKKEKK